MRLEALETLAFQALYVGGRQLTSFRGRTLTAGIRQFDHIPLAPGLNDIRVVYQRYGGPQEVLVTSVTSTALPIATLRGRITDAVTGAPLGGATITVAPDGAEPIAITTASDGRYQTTIPTGAYAVTVGLSGFLPASGTDVAALGEIIETDHALLRWSTGTPSVTPTGSGAASSHVEGVVTQVADGQPLAGAQVRVTSATATLTALSGADGAFAIDGIPVGPFSVAVSKTGYFPLSYTIEDAEVVDVLLAPALRASPTDVAVVATVQNPVTDAFESGVRVTLLGPNTRVLSDAQGRVQFMQVPIGRHSLRLEKQGYADAVVVFDALPRQDGGPTTLAIPYPQTAGSGRCVAVSAGDTAFVRDRFSSRGIPGAQIVAGGQTLVADASGGFLIPALSEAAPHDLVASAENYEPQTLRIVIAPGGNEPLEFGLLSQLRGSVSGAVRDAASQAGLSMATVKVAGSTDQITHTNSDGTFLLDGVTPGTYALEVTHPEYLAGTIPSVSVVDGAAAQADVSLVHRPTVGGIRGRVLDADTNEAIPGAVVSYEALSTTSDSLGHYALAGLPAGMTNVSISAAGYPPTTLEVAVAAALDPGTPTTVGFDPQISATGIPPSELQVEVRLAEGGRVSDPSGRLTLILPPLSINEDARVSVRLADAPEVTSGQAIPLDPSLQAPEIRAVGPEMQIRLEPLTPGGPIPRPVAPWILVHRYSGASASAAGVSEDLLVPYVWNGTSFTMFQVVPYLHAVDAIDRLVVVAVNPGATASGGPLFAGLHGKSLPLYAALDGPQPTSGGFELSVQLAAPPAQPPSPTPFSFVVVRDLRQQPELANPEFPDSEPHPNSHPLIGIPGWDPDYFFSDSPPVIDPFTPTPQGDRRFAQIFTDLVRSTAGIYRPIWTSYNTRARAQATAGAMYSALRGALGDGIRGIPSDPEDPNSGRYQTLDVFGYSKGGLVERSLLCQPNVGIQGAIALATPHHGALSRLRLLLDVPLFAPDPAFPPYLDPAQGVPVPTLRSIIEAMSPGTADLLDYSDSDATENPYLWNLNRQPCSASATRAALISGNDSIMLELNLVLPPMGPPNLGYLSGMEAQGLLPLGTAEQIAGLPRPEAAELLVRLFSLGGALNSGESDGIVPVWSAQGHDRDGLVLPPFAGQDDQRLRVPEPADFNHLDVGTDRQPLGAVLEESVLPTMTDWFTTTQTALTSDEPDPNGAPGARLRRAPTRVEWFSAKAEYSGFLQVLYSKDSNGQWHLLGGADSATGAANEPSVVTGGEPNSLDFEVDGKSINTPIEYFRPTQDAGGNPIVWVETKVLTIALPYTDPEGDPDDKNVFPIDRLPAVPFESAVP